MRTLQGEIWLDMTDLLNAGLTEITIKMGIQRNSPKWQAIRDPDDGRRRLIRYATLRESYKVAVRAELCGGLEPNEWIVMQKEILRQAENNGKRAALVDQLEDVCEEGYRRFLHLYRDYDDRKMRRLSRGAAVVDILAAWYKANNISWKSYEPVKQASEWLKKNKEEYPMYLTTVPTQLKEKVLAYSVDEKPLNELVYLPREGNENRMSLANDIWWQAYAVQLRVDQKNYTQAQIFRKVRELAPIYGKAAPSESSVRAFLNSKEHLTAGYHTDGNNKKGQRHRSSVPSLGPTQVDACWQIDGTKVQFVGHATGKKTKDGRKETKSLSIVAVRDVHSGAFIGYWYGYGEDETAYRCALKMAVDITGKLPYELRYDSFPGSNSGSWKLMEGTKETPGTLEKAGVKLTKTSVASGKAHLERGFYTLQQVFEAEKKEFIGLGIKAGIAHARPTELYIARTQREYLNTGWDFDKAWMSHAGVMATYNHTVVSSYSRKHKDLHLTPWQMYENGATESVGFKPDSIAVAELFWQAREEGIRNNLIKFRVKKDYIYKVSAREFDLLEYQRPGVKVVVKFDPADMSEVMVFSKQGEFLARLKEQSLIPTFGPDADYKALAAYKQDEAEIKKIRKQKLSEYALPDEVASLLATLVPKDVHNDALENYAIQNADRWKVVERTQKEPKVSVLAENFDPVAYARGEYDK